MIKSIHFLLSPIGTTNRFTDLSTNTYTFDVSPASALATTEPVNLVFYAEINR